MPITVTPLQDGFVAEIGGADSSRVLGDGDFVLIKQALLDHKVIAISDLQESFPWLLGLCRRFGPLVPHLLDQYHHPETPECSIIRANAGDATSRRTERPAGAYWHSDLSYDANPSDATFLYSVQVPSKGGDTLFADMVRAYETLPAATKRRIDGRVALHRYGWNGGAAVTSLNAAQQAAHPDVRHPVVRTHAETGRKALFVDPGSTVAILGMEPAESDALLGELYAHALQPRFQYRHKWRKGQLVGMDNRACLHCASADYDEPRTLYRFIVGCTERMKAA